MRLPFLTIFLSSPFDGLLEHAEKVKECSLLFQQAIECSIASQCRSFGEFREQVSQLEHEADAIKRRIRGHIPKGTLMMVDKFQFFNYLKEQDKVLDTVEDILDWISFKELPAIPNDVASDLRQLVDISMSPIEELSLMVSEAIDYFKTFSNKAREVVKERIRGIRIKEHNVDQLEKNLKQKLFSLKIDAVDIFFLIRLVEYIGNIADHAENAGDMMRAMIAQ